MTDCQHCRERALKAIEQAQRDLAKVRFANRLYTSMYMTNRKPALLERLKSRFA